MNDISRKRCKDYWFNQFPPNRYLSQNKKKELVEKFCWQVKHSKELDKKERKWLLRKAEKALRMPRPEYEVATISTETANAYQRERTAQHNAARNRIRNRADRREADFVAPERGTVATNRPVQADNIERVTARDLTAGCLERFPEGAVSPVRFVRPSPAESVPASPTESPAGEWREVRITVSGGAEIYRMIRVGRDVITTRDLDTFSDDRIFIRERDSVPRALARYYNAVSIDVMHNHQFVSVWPRDERVHEIRDTLARRPLPPDSLPASQNILDPEEIERWNTTVRSENAALRADRTAAGLGQTWYRTATGVETI